MADAGEGTTIDRRTLLIGGGAGVGLLLAWAVWPRDYRPNLTPAKGEHVFNAWLKIGEDGHIAVAVPQAEHGQGVYTTLPQILADELGADWRTIAVEPAPLNPLYANPLAADELFAGVFDALPGGFRRAHARRTALVLTAGSTSVRMFGDPLAEAGAAARVLLCKAAAKRWGVAWQACGTTAGFVVHGGDRLRFGELAALAADESLPSDVPRRNGSGNRLLGQSLPRLDTPSKVDGSAQPYAVIVPEGLNATRTQPARLDVILHGLQGVAIDGVSYPSVMPPFAATLNDADIADIANHERTSWDNQAKQVTAEQVKAVRDGNK